MKKIILLSVTLLFSIWIYGQSDLTFYHMGAVTPQSSMNNASFFPDANFYLSFPALSGVNINANIGFTYNDLMEPIPETDSVQFDLENVLREIGEGDNLSFRGDLSLFQLGIGTGIGAFSIFSNLRFEGGMLYPVQFLDYFINGNSNFIGEQVEERNLSAGGIAYHEIGLGYATEINVLFDKRLKVGGRFKYLFGLAHLSGDENASASFYTAPGTYDLSVNFNNATFRTAGLNALQGDDAQSYVIGFGSNENQGFAVDLGGELAINEKWTASFAVNDLGSIHWKQDIENYTLINSSISLNGFEDLDQVDVGQALEDSLDVWSESETSSESFRTSLGTRIIVGGRYNVFTNGFASGSIIRNGSSYGRSAFGYGFGYTHQLGNVLTLSTTVLKEQYQPLEVGAGMMFRIGSLQFYGVFDDVLNGFRDPADVQGASVRLGLNLVFGRTNRIIREKKEKKKKEELSPFPPGYDLDYLNQEDGSQSL